MAEQLANLSKSKDEVQVFEFDVSNLSITTDSNGKLYYGVQTVDTGIDVSNKKVFVTAVLSVDCMISVKRVANDNTKLQVSAYRTTQMTGVSGKIYVMVAD